MQSLVAKNSLRKLVKELERKKAAIGKTRDELNDLRTDIDQLAENCERAEEGIEQAIDALSELC